MALIPNWFETLVRNILLFHCTYVIKTHDEPFYAPSFLNMCLYWQMDSALKKLLCPEDCHTGNAIPKTKDSWSLEENSDCHKYSQHVFLNKNFCFTWAPLFFFPFYQRSNFVYDKVHPQAVPLNLVEKLTARFTFKDNFGNIFKLKHGSTKLYRFNLTKFDMAVEESRLNVGEEKRLYSMNKNNLLFFTGVTKICKPENIPAGVFTHTCRFNNILRF